MPEADGAFGNHADVAGAGTTGGRDELGCGSLFQAALAVVGKGGAVAADLVQPDGCRAGRRNGSRGESCRDRRSVSDRDGRITLIRGTPGVLGTSVKVNIQLRIGMELQPSKPVRRADQGLGAVGTRGQIGKLGGAVAADTIADDSLQAKIDLLGKQRDIQTGAHAATGGGTVASSGGAGSGGAIGARYYDWSYRFGKVAGGGAHHSARKDSVAEGADDAEQLIVAPARIRGGLEDKIRRLVDRVAGGIERVEETSALAWSVDKEILGSGSDAGGRCTGESVKSAAADGGLRTFHRSGE